MSDTTPKFITRNDSKGIPNDKTGIKTYNQVDIGAEGFGCVVSWFTSAYLSKYLPAATCTVTFMLVDLWIERQST